MTGLLAGNSLEEPGYHGIIELTREGSPRSTALTRECRPSITRRNCLIGSWVAMSSVGRLLLAGFQFRLVSPRGCCGYSGVTLKCNGVFIYMKMLSSVEAERDHGRGPVSSSHQVLQVRTAQPPCHSPTRHMTHLYRPHCQH